MIEKHSDFKNLEEIKNYIREYGFEKYLSLFKLENSGWCPTKVRCLNNNSIEACFECCSCGYDGIRGEEEGKEKLEKFKQCHMNVVSNLGLMYFKRNNMEVYQ